MRKSDKKGQVTIFIILAIIIVAGVVLYFILQGGGKVELSPEMQPVYDYYLSCVEEHARQGVGLLGEQGGYIEPPDFILGSQYMPFSSQLDFFGQPVPYWMYVSGNNLLKEQVPSKGDMEEQLADYVGDRLSDCDFSIWNNQGYDVYVEQGSVDVHIKDAVVELSFDNLVVLGFGGKSVSVSSHEINVDSKLGKFYDLALDVYNYEKQNMFLEKYAVDVLRLYAPVAGVELTCSPKVFVDEIIRQDLIEAMSANIGALKLKGSYYDLGDKENKYFVTDVGRNVDENVNFMYMPSWPTRVEIYGDRVVEPVGLQEGLGVLGFCYVPYQLIYDVDFPVLIQFWNEEEIFQFPIAVVIDKNQEREALPSVGGTSIESEVCKYKNQNVDIYTYDLDLNPVEARVKFKCLGSLCSLGETSLEGGEAFLDAQVPQCVNGFIIADAEGYATGKYQISTNEESVANVLMKKKYEVNLDLGNVEQALVRFDSGEHMAVAMYPEMKTIELVEDYYNVSVYVYKNSTLTFPAVSQSKCVDVPKEGIGGFFGLEEEKCFDITIPETQAEFVVVGGGKTQEYITQGQLKDAIELNIKVPLFDTPSSLEQVQINYMEVEDSVVSLVWE